MSGETVLILRTCDPERKSRNGSFQYPASGLVEAPDWKPNALCGNGLHGWLWGAGDWSLKRKDDSLWLVLEVVAADVIDLQGKVKFPRGEVLGVFGRWNEAMEFIRLRRPPVEAESTATGDSGHAAATGNYGHAAATGYSGHAAATGDSGHAAATGKKAVAFVGVDGCAKAGEDGVVCVIWIDKKSRPRLAVGYVGEGGIKADTWYRATKTGRLVKGESK